MKTALFLLLAAQARAHRLDEYLQGTLLSVEKNRMSAEMTLTPGVAVFRVVLANLDTNSDGVVSAEERQAYAAGVLQDLSLRIDGRALTPRLRSVQIPGIAELEAGTGEIRVAFDADLPPGGPSRKLILENHHLSRIAAYQVNCLVSRDPAIHILEQKRNYLQSVYELDFTQPSPTLSLAWFPDIGKPLATIALLSLAWIALLWKRQSEQH
jgi:hypothetical protein